MRLRKPKCARCGQRRRVACYIRGKGYCEPCLNVDDRLGIMALEETWESMLDFAKKHPEWL